MKIRIDFLNKLTVFGELKTCKHLTSGFKKQTQKSTTNYLEWKKKKKKEMRGFSDEEKAKLAKIQGKDNQVQIRKPGMLKKGAAAAVNAAKPRSPGEVNWIG